MTQLPCYARKCVVQEGRARSARKIFLRVFHTFVGGGGGGGGRNSFVGGIEAVLWGGGGSGGGSGRWCGGGGSSEKPAETLRGVVGSSSIYDLLPHPPTDIIVFTHGSRTVL